MIADVVLEDARWEALDLEALADRAAEAAFAELGIFSAGFTFALLACDDARIKELNAEFREKDKPTNVLSWPSEERGADEPGGVPELPEPGDDVDPEELGDIAMAFETCAREAEEAGRPMADHVTHLVIHALLHLLGYDHIEDADATLMEGIEVRALARLGIADPY